MYKKKGKQENIKGYKVKGGTLKGIPQCFLSKTKN